MEVERFMEGLFADECNFTLLRCILLTLCGQNNPGKWCACEKFNSVKSRQKRTMSSDFQRIESHIVCRGESGLCDRNLANNSLLSV